jgi:hypothetical protein
VENTKVDAGLHIETLADFAALVANLERSPVVEPILAAAALSEVRHGVITGEGPTTMGRAHFSRSIDAADTAMVRRILLAGGSQAVTRAEADALFDIHEAACERVDGGAFDDLLAKAIAHHVLAAAGFAVPARAAALAPTTALADWASPEHEALDRELVAWLERRLARPRRHHAALVALAAWVGVAASWTMSIAAAIDLAA